MDAFENVIATLLEKNGFWIRTSVKVHLSQKERRTIGRPTNPRWELDLVAYNASKHEVWVVECKSYLDSPGVSFADLFLKGKQATRYKLFTEKTLQKVALSRLKTELVRNGFCTPNPKIILGLAAGHIRSKPDLEKIKISFAKNKLKLLDPEWIKTQLKTVASESYENSVAAIVSKLLLR